MATLGSLRDLACLISARKIAVGRTQLYGVLFLLI
jgi:hypothetical protein